MIKQIISILIFLSHISVFSRNYDSTSSLKKEIYVETGHSTSAFIQNYNGAKINNYGLSCFKIGYNNKRIGYFIDKFSFGEYNIPYEDGIAPKGYTTLRNYVMFNIGAKYRFNNSKFKLNIEPFLLLSYRKYGTDEFYIDQNKIVYPVISYYSHFFYYEQSAGLGFGINFNKKIYKNLNFSFGLQYNHFYEKIKYDGDRYNSQQYNDMIRNYKISNDFLTTYLNIGYKFMISK